MGPVRRAATTRLSCHCVMFVALTATLVLTTAASAAAAPQGTRAVGRVTIEDEDVWTAADIDSARPVLRLLRRGMNGLHTRTREGVIRRELLVAPGEPCDPERLAETERNLRALGLFAEVAVTAADTLPDGTADVRVRVREAWTLRTLFGYARSSAGEQRWNVLLEDGNFLGGGTRLTAGAGGDEDRTWRQVGWRLPRVRGSEWLLSLYATDQSDGQDLALLALRPFRAQDDPWSAQLQLWRRDAEVRWYVSNAGPAGADPARARSLYAELPARERVARLTWLRRAGGRDGGRLWRLGGGLELIDHAYRVPAEGVALSDDRAVAAAALRAGAPTLGRDAQSVAKPFLALETLGRRWTTGRFLFQYGAVEDVPLDPVLTLRAGWSARSLGAEREALFVDLAASDWSRAPGGLRLIDARAQACLGGDAQRGALADLVAGWIAQAGGLQGRLFAEAAAGDRLGGREALQLGLMRGLRTLDYDGQAGDRLVRWTAEAGRPLPWQLLGFWQLGLAAHYAGGAAWWRGEERGPGDARHEAGVGLRIGASRSGRAETARLDLSWDLSGGAPVVTAVTGGLF